MKIPFSHVNIQGLSCAIFDADANARTDLARQALLGQLTAKVRLNGLAVHKRALAFMSGGRMTFLGDPDLVAYLGHNWLGIPWNYTLEV